MCFSPGFSFGAGVVLSLMGIATIRKTSSIQQKAFAAIPLIFSSQQIIEGFLWIGLTNPEFNYLKIPCTYLFLLIAQVVWPFYLPFSIYRLTKDPKPGGIIAMTGLSIVIAMFQLYQLAVFRVDATVEYFHIAYQQDYPESPFYFTTIMYLVLTIVPPFFSEYKKIRMLGFTVLFSSLFTQAFFPHNFISVWCFFAAIISGVVYYLVVDMNKPAEIVKLNAMKYNS
jgi:hypothetical protein